MILRKRPHFSVRDAQVFFLNAQRPMSPFSDAAMALLTRLDAEGTLAGQSVDDPVADELVKRGVCDLIAPVDATNRASVLVLEPHGDDAALSIGAYMWQQRETLDFTLVTLASRSNYTSSFHTGREFFNRDTVSGLRRAEGEIFMTYLGGSYDVLDMPEATLRYENDDWSLDFFKAHRTSVAINNNRRAADDVLARWVSAVTPLMVDPKYSEIWVPLGAGTHSDHDLTRNAALEVLRQNPDILGRTKVLFYKDVPYGIDCQEHTDRLLERLRHAGAEIADHTVDVTDVFQQKLDMIGIFASQFKGAHVHPGMKRSAATGAAEGRQVEHLWHLKKMPEDIDLFDLFIEEPIARNITPALVKWRENGDEVRRIRVLALGASGNWAGDEALLRTRFPNAAIEVYASPATRAEIAARKSADVVLHDVARGTRPWVLLALKLAVAAPAHTLFIAGERVDAAQKLSRLWPLHRTIVVQAMDHVALALRRLVA